MRTRWFALGVATAAVAAVFTLMSIQPVRADAVALGVSGAHHSVILADWHRGHHSGIGFGFSYGAPYPVYGYPYGYPPYPGYYPYGYYPYGSGPDVSLYFGGGGWGGGGWHGGGREFHGGGGFRGGGGGFHGGRR